MPPHIVPILWQSESPTPVAPPVLTGAAPAPMPLDLAALRACPHAEDTPPRFGTCGSCRTRECRLGGLHEVDLATCLACEVWRAPDS